MFFQFFIDSAVVFKRLNDCSNTIVCCLVNDKAINYYNLIMEREYISMVFLYKDGFFIYSIFDLFIHFFINLIIFIIHCVLF